MKPNLFRFIYNALEESVALLPGIREVFGVIVLYGLSFFTETGEPQEQ